MKTYIVLGVIIGITLYNVRQHKLKKLVEHDNIEKEHIQKTDVNHIIFNRNPRPNRNLILI